MQYPHRVDYLPLWSLEDGSEGVETGLDSNKPESGIRSKQYFP